MNAFTRRCACLVVLSLLLTASKPAKADSGNFSIGPIGPPAIVVVLGVVAIVAAVTVTVALVHKPTITGCVAQGNQGLTLQSEAEKKTYILHGDVQSLKAGERVKVKGKYERGKGSGFKVLELKKNYGACPAHG